MEPPAEASIDFSEVFAGDKIAFNTQKLHYWCVSARTRARAVCARLSRRRSGARSKHGKRDLRLNQAPWSSGD